MNAEAWSDVTRGLVDVAMGRAPADLVVRNGRWVCVQSGEIIAGTDVAAKSGRIAYVGENADHTIGPGTRIVDARGHYMVPGLLDGHTHIESGLVTLTQFVRAVLPHGTTGVFIDPHEITNVVGLTGVRMMVDEAAPMPIHVWVEVPACVPPAPGLETSGAEIGPAEVAEAMSWPGVIGLGEMMNFPGVIAGDERMHAEMAATRVAGGVVGGHYASHDLGQPFHGYAAGGAEDEHEGTRLEDAVARVRQGMKVLMRLGSGYQDVAAQIRAVTELGLDPRHFVLVTDGAHASTLVHEGHMDRVVRHAIRQGVPPIVAIQMATLNAAEHFGVARDVGQIAPGRFADILLVSDLPAMAVETVIARGAVAVQDGTLELDLPAFARPGEVWDSVHLARPLTAGDFAIPVKARERVRAHVIGLVPNQAPTRHLVLEFEPVDGQIEVDSSREVAKLALVERHHATGQVRMGLVQGFGFDVPCAVASTLVHDADQMVVVGTDEESMAAAANELARVGGGQIVVKAGEVIALLELPIGGVMSDERAEVVAAKTKRLLEGFRECGCPLNNPNVQLSLLGLVVIPELRISDRGLVDSDRFKVISLIEGDQG